MTLAHLTSRNSSEKDLTWQEPREYDWPHDQKEDRTRDSQVIIFNYLIILIIPMSVGGRSCVCARYIEKRAGWSFGPTCALDLCFGCGLFGGFGLDGF